MPIYEYKCHDCDERFELMRRMMEADSPIICQNCHSASTSRLLSLFNAQSSGRIVAGGQSSCTSCSSNACATCRH